MKIKLSDYYHDRTRNVSETVPELYNYIEQFTEQKSVLHWYSWFKDNFGLPKSVIDQYVKKYIADDFDYLGRKSFGKNTIFGFSTLIKGIIKYLGFTNYIMFRRNNKKIIRINREIILDHIEWDETLHRYKKLISLFKKENVITIVPNKEKINLSDIEIMNRPHFINYRINFDEYKIIIKGLLFHFSNSININANLFGLTIGILDSYFYYRTIFELINSKYIINQQHYQTDSIKNYLFKQMGGECSAVIQKNIHQQGHNGLYYDADIFFTMGNKTANRAIKFGAQLGNVVPVGSFFMEYYWFNREKERIPQKKYEIVFLGINVSTGKHFIDIYDSFIDDYYETFKWLVYFSKNNPNINIGIKHHPGNKIDEIEMKIIKGSNVERIESDLNSYEIAFQAKCAVTFGSTMGFELISQGVPVFFLDPGKRDNQLLPDNFDNYSRVTSQEEFVKKITQVLNGKYPLESESLEKDFCLNSQNVSESIYSELLLYNNN